MPDEGFRHADTVYNQEWLARLPGWPGEATHEPETLSAIEAREEWEWTRYEWGRAPLNVEKRPSRG